MNTFLATYAEGVTEGLSWPNTDDEKKNNASVMKQRLASNWQQLEVAKVLDGLTIHSRQEFIGTFCFSGPQEKIDALKTFLKESKLGTVTPNVRLTIASSAE